MHFRGSDSTDGRIGTFKYRRRLKVKWSWSSKYCSYHQSGQFVWRPTVQSIDRRCTDKTGRRIVDRARCAREVFIYERACVRLVCIGHTPQLGLLHFVIIKLFVLLGGWWTISGLVTPWTSAAARYAAYNEMGGGDQRYYRNLLKCVQTRQEPMFMVIRFAAPGWSIEFQSDGDG